MAEYTQLETTVFCTLYLGWVAYLAPYEDAADSLYSIIMQVCCGIANVVMHENPVPLLWLNADVARILYCHSTTISAEPTRAFLVRMLSRAQVELFFVLMASLMDIFRAELEEAMGLHNNMVVWLLVPIF